MICIETLREPQDSWAICRAFSCNTAIGDAGSCSIDLLVVVRPPSLVTWRMDIGGFGRSFLGLAQKIRGKIKSQKTNVFQGEWPFSAAMFLHYDIFLPGKGDLRGELEKHAKIGLDAGLDF